MTRGHRLAAASPQGTRPVRPAIVVLDPVLAASQPVPELAASALNALGHAVEAPLTPRANPVVHARGARGGAAHRRARSRSAGSPTAMRSRSRAMLAGYSIDSASYGLHHVLSQTLVRIAGIAHGAANAVMLPHTIGALAWRFRGAARALEAAMGGDPADVAAAHHRADRRDDARPSSASTRPARRAPPRTPRAESGPTWTTRRRAPGGRRSLALYEHAL